MNSSKEKTKDNVIVAEGEVIEVLPGLEYKVKINYKGLEHVVLCYVSGKMRNNFIQLAKDDLVRVEISMYDIDKGRIVYRVNKKVSIPNE